MDGFAGFKKLHHFPNVALAVSKTDKMEAGKVYEAPAGWHWGSRAEVAAIMGGGAQERVLVEHYYFGHGGWDLCAWRGVDRCCWRSAAARMPRPKRGTSPSTTSTLKEPHTTERASPGSSAWPTSVHLF